MKDVTLVTMMRCDKCLSQDITTVASAQFALSMLTSCSLVDIDFNRKQSDTVVYRPVVASLQYYKSVNIVMCPGLRD
jgi:hypothetical protein